MKKIYQLLFILPCFLSSKATAQCTTASTVPYYEDFSSIVTPTQLPICWAVSNTVTCLTFTAATNSSGLAFYYQPNGTSYFYSNAIHLKAGITYSVSLWHRVNPNAAIMWNTLSISLGTSQSSAGLVQVASLTNVVSTSYAALSNTFAVTTTGDYYVAIGATSFGTTGSQYLYWDDLAIMIPCTPSYNSPSVSIVPSSTAVCSGQQLTLTAAGADSYVWGNGATTASVVESGLTGSFSVVGTSTLSGCSRTVSIFIPLNPSPNVLALAGNSVTCSGTSVNITAYGSVTTYSWSGGEHAASISVSPSITTTYSVTGTNAFGCSGTSSQLIVVNPLPTISVVASPTAVCPGEDVLLNATGASSFQWISNSIFFPGDTLVVSTAAFTTFTVLGTDTNNCSAYLNYAIQINDCTGLNEFGKSAQTLRAYPNPGNGVYTITSGNLELKSILIIDLTGKTVLSLDSPGEKISVDLNALPAGVYQVKMFSASGSDHLKLVKQ